MQKREEIKDAEETERAHASHRALRCKAYFVTCPNIDVCADVANNALTGRSKKKSEQRSSEKSS
jgi:hypothetical protein